MDVSCCSKLESLESETHLESLSDLVVQGCSSLKRFCLSSKKLRAIYLGRIPVEIFHLPSGHCTELRQLIFNGSRLRSLPIDELCCLTNLEVFEVTDFEQVIDTMKLHSLFYAWRNLKRLRLDGWSYLTKIPDSIRGLTRLEYLSLADSGVETLPAYVNHLSSLKRISLRSCKSLKSTLGLPPFLKELDATGCTLLETVSSDSLLHNWCRFYFHNCVKLDESSLHFIEELTHPCDDEYYEDDEYDEDDEFDEYYNALACYPGSRVLKWMKYKQMTEASNTIEFTCNLEGSNAMLFCCVAPGHLVSKGLYDVWCDISHDDNKFHSKYGGTELEYLKLNSDHVFLWFKEGGLFGAGTGNDAKISCKFFLKHGNDEEEDYSIVPVKACGVHLISYSDLDSETEPESG